MGFRRPQIWGVVNLTADSFSDGGRYLETEAALAHARRLREDGADVIDLGPASSHPDSAAVAPQEEIRRLGPVVDALLAEGIPVSVDSFRGETQVWAIGRGVTTLNDVRGFGEPRTWPDLARSGARLVLMHSIRAAGAATRERGDPDAIVGAVDAFFAERIAALEAAGIARERLVLDPGMGFFLGDTPEPSLRVLAALERLRERHGLPLLVCVSRKSFLGGLTGAPVAERGPATLAAELWAARHGVDHLRTHDVRAICEALTVESALQSAGTGDGA
ncbi:MAG: dihydropteroate synthase [Deltaproteobacteria bacterium]|nr:dihydropteroate synthase [Deltaproteobacteria bacterium]